MRNEAAILWSRALKKLKAMLNDEVFKLWFAPIVPIHIDNNVLILQVANDFCEVWLKDNYHHLLEEVVGETSEDKLGIAYRVESKETPQTQNGLEHPAMSNEKTSTIAKGPVTPSVPDKKPDHAQNGFNPFYTFDSFVVGANNRMAHSAALAVAQLPGKSYNPLFLYGGVGLGKTHLLHAIGHQVLHRKRNARVAYLSCEKFTNEFIDGIQNNQLVKFRKRYRQTDVLLIDDIQFLSGKERIQEEFFHTFNALHEAHKQIVLSCDSPACEIDGLEQRLSSRFEWGLSADLQPPDVETRLAILLNKEKSMGVSIPREIVEYIANNIRANIRRLEGALLRVAAFSSLTKQELTLEIAEQLLRDALQEEGKSAISIDVIQKKVAEHYDIRLVDMTSRRRPEYIAFPRQIAMYLSRQLTESSLNVIGGAFGGRDHGTVLHACRLVKDRMEMDTSVRQAVLYLERQLQ
ncbi:MAG: chromosomal replication initiator protein DnaA [Verrucomicrobiota bacterium]|jgi:chromosomal replication initiator protein|nr:chromosomal replication initiator protein DnaA [Verrucomicrobiota bacterium]